MGRAQAAARAQVAVLVLAVAQARAQARVVAQAKAVAQVVAAAKVAAVVQARDRAALALGAQVAVKAHLALAQAGPALARVQQGLLRLLLHRVALRVAGTQAVAATVKVPALTIKKRVSQKT